MTMKNRFKVGFIGGAFDSAVGLAHRTAIEMDRCFELVSGVFSRDPDKSRVTAVKYGIDVNRAYSDIESFLNKETKKIDAVVILSPQDQHTEHTLKCLDAGIPVICEKSLTTTVEEAAKIDNKLAGHKGFLAVTYNYTGYPMVRELKALISEGKLGVVQQIHMEMPQEGFSKVTLGGDPIVPQAWRLKDGHKIPTISLDLGVHLHMMARFLISQSPDEVIATSDTFGNFSDIVDNVSCLVRYSGGAVGNLWYGKTAFGYRNGMKIRVFGSKGAAEWVQEKPEYLFLADNMGNRSIIDRGSPNIKIATQARYQRFKVGHPAGFIEAFSNYYYDIANWLKLYLSGEYEVSHEYAFGIKESLEGLRFLEAVSRSCENRIWEKCI